VTDSNLPWPKSEIIEAVRAEIEPETPGMMSKKPVALYAFARLALGKPEGRASPHAEHELLKRMILVCCAITRGHDPETAFDIPLPDEAPLTYKEHDAQMLEIIDTKLRKGAEVTPALFRTLN
jgi:hypothetical protein